MMPDLDALSHYVARDTLGDRRYWRLCRASYIDTMNFAPEPFVTCFECMRVHGRQHWAETKTEIGRLVK